MSVPSLKWLGDMVMRTLLAWRESLSECLPVSWMTIMQIKSNQQNRFRNAGRCRKSCNL